MLWQYLGVAVISGLVVMILMVPVSGVIAGKLRDLQVVQMKVKDERVKSMNEILNGMKVLKLYAWEPSFEKLIFGTREKEMTILQKTALLNAGTYFVWSLGMIFMLHIISSLKFHLIIFLWSFSSISGLISILHHIRVDGRNTHTKRCLRYSCSI